MKISLLDSEVSPYQDISLDEDGVDEHSHLTLQCINEDEQTYFQTLDSQIVKTKKGNIKVAIQGDRNNKGTAMVTLHDIGQNHVTCFQSYFCYYQIKPLLKHFTIYHINFPGQEENAKDLPEDYEYPTMEEMSDVVREVTDYFDLKKMIGFGVGAGANVLARLALKAPQLVDCLILVNGNSGVATWSEWGYEKMCSHYLKTAGMTTFVQDYFVYHYFGKVDEKTKIDLVDLVHDQLQRIRSPKNLGLFIESYSKRDALKMNRSGVAGQPSGSTTSIKCGVLVITGDHSPAVDETVNLNRVG